MRRSSARSTDRRRRPRAAAVDVYLFPAVVGGGLGDIEEVLAGGRHLARAGFPLRLYRRPGRPLPRSVDGPFDWPAHTRISTIGDRAPAAMTVSPCWGVSAAPSRPERYGRGGAWEEECADVEEAYGPDRTLHVSLEEFARTLTSREETVERYREGGVPLRAIRARSRTAGFAEEIAQFHREFVRFRAFDRPNLLHLYATFRPHRPFTREFPSAVQCGPLYSGRIRPPPRARVARGPRGWVWYASPGSAERLLDPVREGLASNGTETPLLVRTPRPIAVPSRHRSVRIVVGATGRAAWRREFERAHVRVVTGSRTLLEAIELGGPFLYFNGIAGSARTHRHRPEKIVALIDLGRRIHAPPGLLRDLTDFSEGRRVREIVRRADRRTGDWATFPRFRSAPPEFPPPYDDAGRLLVAVARALGREPGHAVEIVREVRSGRFGRAAVRTAAG